MALPDYQGGSIVNLMASLQAGLGGSAHAYPTLRQLPPQQVARHRNVLLWVIDGLGLNLLRANPQAGCLNAHTSGAMTSVYPPTTAAAITTFLTGDAPQQHGLTGWHMYFHELGSVLAVLPGRARYGGVGLAQAGIDVGALLGQVPFSERIEVAAWQLAPASIARSDFNLAHLGRARLLSYRDLPDMLSQAAGALAAPGRNYVYAYWPELDRIGHHQGICSAAASDHLRTLDQAFETLLEQLRGTDTLVIVCADHGQIDSLDEQRIDLQAHPALAQTLALPLCGEPRSAYCYLRPDRVEQFDQYVRTELAGAAQAYAGSHLIEAGWFGTGAAHPQLQRRIGDRVLLMRGRYLLKDWLAQEKPYELIGVHGGLSDDELYVPLVAASA